MNIEIRHVVGLRKMFFIFAMIFLAFAIFWGGIPLVDPAHSFKHPIGSALFFGGFWGIGLVISLIYYLYLRGYWLFDETGMARKGLFPRRVRWEDVLVFRIEKNEQYGIYKLTFYQRGGGKFKIDGVDLNPDSCRHLIESLREYVKFGILEVRDLPDFMKNMKRDLVYAILVILICVFFMVLFNRFL